jgi:taurine dioxygenase
MESATKLRTRPLKDGFGAEILDVDVTRADPQTLRDLVTEFHHHGAIVLRGQNLDPPAQLAFTNLFGPPAETQRNKEYTLADYPEIYLISNRVVNGRHIGDYAAGLNWHTDLSYSARPALCTILHALEVPDEGSDTMLADLCAAWKALPKEKQEAIDDLVVHYSFAQHMERRGQPLTPEQKLDHPDVFHPLVCRHPADGRKVLWVSPSPMGVVGMPSPAGQGLLVELTKYVTQERFVYRHKWQVGDILVWDNRCTLHSGSPFDKQKYIRLVHRTWVRGNAPVH